MASTALAKLTKAKVLPGKTRMDSRGPNWLRARAHVCVCACVCFECAGVCLCACARVSVRGSMDTSHSQHRFCSGLDFLFGLLQTSATTTPYARSQSIRCRSCTSSLTPPLPPAPPCTPEQHIHGCLVGLERDVAQPQVARGLALRKVNTPAAILALNATQLLRQHQLLLQG